MQATQAMRAKSGTINQERFSLWAKITVCVTFLMMFWGNLVSSTGSGLACPDWPLCYGTILPPAEFDIILEWGHRCLGAITAFFMITTCWKAYQYSKSHDGVLFRAAISLPVLLMVQIFLGGITVLLHLSTAVSSIHLILATILFSAMITIAVVAKGGVNEVALHSDAKVRRLAVAGLMGLLLQFLLGGILRHGHFALACPQFPQCFDQILPIPFTAGTALAFLHRWWGVALWFFFIQLAIAAYRRAPLVKGVAIATAVVATAQVLLGIITVLGRLQIPSRALHAGLGYFLWGLLFYLAIRSGALQWTYLSKQVNTRR